MDEKRRFRRFCLTWNNYDEKSLDTIVNCGFSYLIVGEEVGKNGTPHYQIYVEFNNALTFSAIIKRFKKKCHVEVARATEEKNREYCSKQKVIFEEGTPFKQGDRNDLKDIKIEITKGSNIRTMLENEKIINYQGLRTAEALMKYIEPVRTQPPKVIWRYGGAGVGKSKWVYENYTEVFVPVSYKWWEGYDGHKTVLLDDLRGDFCKYHEFLKLIDRYPFRVECKGGSRQLLAETIIITSPYHPKEIWDTIEDKKQLLRRITKIEEITQK